MSEPKETTDKTAGGERKPLTLKRSVESGHIQQKFSHGRSKSVEVVKKRKRMVLSPEAEQQAKSTLDADKPGVTTAKVGGGKANVSRPPQRGRPGGTRPSKSTDAQQQTLSEGELEARARALQAAQLAEQDRARREAEQRRIDEEQALQRQSEAEQAQSSQEPSPAVSEAEPTEPAEAADVSEATVAEVPSQQTTATQEQPAADAQPEQKPESEPEQTPVLTQLGMIRPEIVVRERPARKPQQEAPPPKEAEKPAAARPRPARPAAEVTEDDDGDRKRSGKPARGGRTADDQRFRGRLTITNALDESQRQRSIASLKRRREREKMKAQGPQQREKIVREVIIPEAITIQELANRMTERAVDVIRFLMQQGAMHKINDVIDADTAELIVAEFGHTAKRVSEADVEEGFIGSEDVEVDLEPRAPVVTIMGHVDHGKTSLLDALRQTNVVSGEAGGITQHIGAYQVTTEAGAKITFIDTPGHEAFTAMRARGAKVTDIVVLVVAADDGVMPQTVEAINHAKAAEVPIIVAINKIDKPGVDPNRVRTELLQHEIVVETMSGETLEVEVSALKRINLDKLLEAVHLQSELLELKANPNRSADGFVIEAKLERGRGPVGTLLVQRGTLKVGDIVVAGMSWGRVRAMIDDQGRNMQSAGPSVPVEVLGFDSAPEAGDQFAVVENEQRAREITDYRLRKRRDTLGSAGTARTLEQMMQQLRDADRKEIRVLVKGDVQGSVEAIAGSLRKLGTDEVEARIVHEGVGGITESDVSLASASNAIIIGFNVRANTQARAAAEREGVEIRYYNVIYDLVDEVKSAMSGLLAPTIKENFIGYAKILEVFNISKIGKVAGCQVTEGRVERGAGVRLLRDNVVIHTGKLSTLKRFKDEVKEVQVGQECGMAFENYQDIREGDQIECFTTETIARSL
ncbi:MAG: translation initiation factor [Pseudomonadota bacterium]|jgi:translation initiation factor IF-2